MKAVDVLLVSTVTFQGAPQGLRPEELPVNEPVLLLPPLGFRIDRVEHGLAEQVMDDCEPKGMSKGTRQWGCTWGFFRENPPEKSRSEPFAWDPDRLIYSTLALSRLVQPNTITTEYAARVVPLEGADLEVHPGPVAGRSAGAWLHESIRKRWLTKADAEALASLLAVYWPMRDTLPGRIKRALWNHEYTAQTHDFNVRLIIVVSALEALVHTDRFKSTQQFGRVAQLGTELGIAFSASEADEAYDLRSHVAHGDRLASLLDTSDPKRQAAQERRMTDLQLAMEKILREAIRRGMEDPIFRTIFEDAASIRARWPI